MGHPSLGSAGQTSDLLPPAVPEAFALAHLHTGQAKRQGAHPDPLRVCGVLAGGRRVSRQEICGRDHQRAAPGHPAHLPRLQERLAPVLLPFHVSGCPERLSVRDPSPAQGLSFGNWLGCLGGGGPPHLLLHEDNLKGPRHIEKVW